MITYVYCPIHEKFISRALYTLYKYSEPGTFNVVVVDQTKNGFSKETMDYVKPLIHLYLHPHRNLGFSKAMNEGIIHALHWKSDYVCIANDDIEIINKRWIQGVMDTFAMDEKIMGVVPMSPRVAGWGYGVSYNPEVIEYKEEYTEDDYNYLLTGDFSTYKGQLPKTFPAKIPTGSLVDGAAFIMVYFKRECLEKIGLLDEHFFPGSGEDYDYLARTYKAGYRLVSTPKSWVWHHWSKSKDLFASGELEDKYYKPKPYWNNMGELWPEGMDIWGHKTNEEGKKIPLPRVEEVFVDSI